MRHKNKIIIKCEILKSAYNNDDTTKLQMNSFLVLTETVQYKTTDEQYHASSLHIYLYTNSVKHKRFTLKYEYNFPLLVVPGRKYGDATYTRT